VALMRTTMMAKQQLQWHLQDEAMATQEQCLPSSIAFKKAHLLLHFLLLLQFQRAVRNNNTATMHAARSMASGQSVSISVNSEHASPPCASLPAVHPTVIQHSPAIANALINNNAPHEVAEIQGHELLDNASSLSATDNDNAKSMWLLHQYFQSLAQSGTTRSIMEEKDLITTKISILFKPIKFINADTDLTFEGNIAKVLNKEMRIPDAQGCLVGTDEEPCKEKDG